MRISNSHQQHGFSLLELVIVVVLISLLIVIAIDRLLVLRVEAERVSVEKIAGELRSAMSLTVASVVVKDGGLQNIARLNKSNPMNMLSQAPGTYLGEMRKAEPERIEPGSWYFDIDRGELVYKVINAGNLVTDLEGVKRIRFQLQLDYGDSNRNGRYDAGRDIIYGMRLQALDPYRWQLDRDVASVAREIGS